MQRIAVLLLIVLISACSSGSSTPPPEDPLLIAEDNLVDIYMIGVGDVISVHVWGNPDLSMQVPVRPDGYISIPLIGDIAASGFDAETLAANVTQLLQTQIRNPQVTVIVNQVNSTEYVTRVRITGAVQNPMSIPYARGMTVLDAVLEAGGPSEMAAPNRAKLYRQVNSEYFELEIRLTDILDRGRMDTNYPMRPGDTITIPERLF